MKNILLSTLTLLLMLSAGLPAQGGNPVFYAATLHELNGHGPGFICNDGSSNIAVFKGPIDASDNTVTMRCGANCNGTYYGLLYKDGRPVRFVTVDWENGKATDVVTLADGYPAFTDMAYNFSTGKLYAILPSDDGTEIYEIAVGDASYSKVKELDFKARAFEFGLDGNMYVLYSMLSDDGWSDNAVLAYFDKNMDSDGISEISSPWQDNVKIYDYGTYNIHSFEFDHAANVLYWTATDAQQQYLYPLDVKMARRDEGKMLSQDENWSANVDAVSLYIPFTMPDGGLNSAGSVSDLTAVADENGGNSVTLSWTNPSLNFGGDALDGLYSVRIYRNGTGEECFAGEITENVTVGGEMSWTDEAAAGGLNTYYVIPCRVDGEQGLSSNVSVYVGFDIPLSVGSVSLEKVGSGIKVTWTEPQGTVNGGVLDKTTLRYDVVRQPDGAEIVKDAEATSLVDETPLPSWERYSYEITPKTAAGAGETSTGWASIYAGPDFTAPYETTFDDEDANQMWEKVNSNKDGYDGYIDSYKGMFIINAVYWLSDDERPKKNLNNWLISPAISLTAGKYKVSVESYIKSSGTSNVFDVKYGKGQTVEAQVNDIQSFEYTASADEETDMAEAEFELAEDGSYNFSVHLKAPKLEEDYEHSTLGIGYFKIERTGDLSVPTEKVIVGDKQNAEMTNASCPVYAYAASESEMIYTKKQLGLRKGDVIRKISYICASNGEEPVTVSVVGNIGSTVEDSYDRSSIVSLKDGMTQFFGGECTIPVAGDVEDGAEHIPFMELPLSEPYVYDGKNIALAYEASQPDVTDFGILSNKEEDGAERVQSILLRKTADNAAYEAALWLPVVVLDVVRADVETFSVNGIVTDSNDNPVEGAVVEITCGRDAFTAQTGAVGTFTMSVDGVRDVYDVKVTKEGYDDISLTFAYEGEDVVELGTLRFSPTSGIGKAETGDDTADAAVYDLSGRLLRKAGGASGEKLNLKKGVYIVNGKKVVID